MMGIRCLHACIRPEFAQSSSLHTVSMPSCASRHRVGVHKLVGAIPPWEEKSHHAELHAGSVQRHIPHTSSHAIVTIAVQVIITFMLGDGARACSRAT